MYFHPPPTMPNGNMMMMPMPQMPPLGMGSGGGGGAPYLLHNPPIMGPSIPAPPGAMMSPLSSSCKSHILLARPISKWESSPSEGHWTTHEP